METPGVTMWRRLDTFNSKCQVRNVGSTSHLPSVLNNLSIPYVASKRLMSVQRLSVSYMGVVGGCM